MGGRCRRVKTRVSEQPNFNNDELKLVFYGMTLIAYFQEKLFSYYGTNPSRKIWIPLPSTGPFSCLPIFNLLSRWERSIRTAGLSLTNTLIWGKSGKAEYLNDLTASFTSRWGGLLIVWPGVTQTLFMDRAFVGDEEGLIRVVGLTVIVIGWLYVFGGSYGLATVRRSVSD